MSKFEEQNDRDVRQDAREVRQDRREGVMLQRGIVLQPWLVTLLISLIVQLIGAAFVTGTVITRIDALTSRIERLEKQADAVEERKRSPINYVSPPVGGFGSPLAHP